MFHYHHARQNIKCDELDRHPSSGGECRSSQILSMKLAKYKVYYNLHKKCLSLMFRGRVIRHAVEFALKNVEFRVSELGRQRVLRNKRKNVHAFVCGELDDGWPVDQLEQQIIYNPYKYRSFVRADTKRPIYRAKYAFVIGKQVYVLN